MTDARPTPIPKPTVDKTAIKDARERLAEDEALSTDEITHNGRDEGGDPADSAAEAALIPRPKI